LQGFDQRQNDDSLVLEEDGDGSRRLEEDRKKSLVFVHSNQEQAIEVSVSNNDHADGVEGQSQD
jgi:hypothetical protein